MLDQRVADHENSAARSPQ